MSTSRTGQFFSRWLSRFGWGPDGDSETLSPLVEARIQTAIQEAQAFTEERISQAHERVLVQQAQAFTEQQILQVLEQVEARVQHTAGEMKAYLDEKTNFLNSSTSAMGKALAEVTKRADTSFDNPDARLPDARFRALETRIEQVRAELLQELRTALGLPNNVTSEPSAFVPKVLNEAKLTRRKVWGVKLNLGCGHHPLEDYLNVDTQEMPGVDIVADIADLPFQPGEVQEILASHLAARFSAEQLHKGLLPHWHRILTPGGKLVIVAKEDDSHQHIWTPVSVQSALAEAGFQNIEMEDENRHNETGLEFRISARKNDQ
jgi:hypothetical protein